MLPSWMDSFMRRSEISGALTAYTQSASLSFTDILRIAIRLLIMPFVSMAGTDNKDTLLLMERLSPLFLLLPAAAYGTGYLRGPSVRAGVHTEIAANNRKRISREKKERRARAERNQKGPEQLN